MLGVVGHQESIELDPPRGHARAELCDAPPSLLGVPGEGTVVRVHPRLLVASRLEGPRDERPRRRDDVCRQRERDTHLEHIAFGGKTQGPGEVVVWRPRLHGPQVHGRAGRHLGDGAPHECGGERAPRRRGPWGR